MSLNEFAHRCYAPEMPSSLLPPEHPSSCQCPASFLTTVLRPLGSWPEGPFHVTYCRNCGALTFTREVTEGHPKDWLETVGFEVIALEPAVDGWLRQWIDYPAAWPSESPPDRLPGELAYFRKFWRVLQCNDQTPTSELIECAALDQAAFKVLHPLLQKRDDLENTICTDVEAPGVLEFLFPSGIRTPRVLDALMTRLETLTPKDIHRAERLCLKLEGLRALQLLPRLDRLIERHAVPWIGFGLQYSLRSRCHALLERCATRLRTDSQPR
jgi:hypothetical protein